MNNLLEALKAAQRSVELAEEALRVLGDDDSVSCPVKCCGRPEECNQLDEYPQLSGYPAGGDDISPADLVNLVGVVLDIWQASCSYGDKDLSALCVKSLEQFVVSTIE